MRTLSRSFVLICLVSLVSALGMTVALAHATYKSSNPADESTVSAAPSQITAEFTEPMTGGSYMDVTDPCGRDTGSGSSQTGNSMSVQNSGTAAGTYAVFWRAVSIDGHVTEGTFTFTSSGGDPCPGEDDPAEDTGSITGGGSGGSGGGGGSGDGGTSEASNGSTGAGSGGGDRNDRHSDGRHGAGGDGGGRRGSRDRDRGSSTDGEGGAVLADGPQSDVPDAPSALEGIPLDGLLFTLGVAALIGAAAGKIFVSLSGDE